MFRVGLYLAPMVEFCGGPHVDVEYNRATNEEGELDAKRNRLCDQEVMVISDLRGQDACPVQGGNFLGEIDISHRPFSAK